MSFSDIWPNGNGTSFECRSPACRHAVGTISRPCVQGLWRIVSEDSDELVPGFPPVHRLHDLNDVRKTRVSLVVIDSHQLDARRELLEITTLRCSKRMVSKERDDSFE